MGMSDGGKTKKNSAQPEGMGLEKKKKNNSKDASKIQRGGPNRAKAADDISQGAEQVSRGATKTAQGVGKVKSGNLAGGVKDVAKGAKDTAQGAKKVGQGVNQMQKNKKSSGRPPVQKFSSKQSDPEYSPGMRDPYNADNYESLFKDDGEGRSDSVVDDALGKRDKDDDGDGKDKSKDDDKDKKDKDSVVDDDDKKDKKGEGIKDLMDDDDEGGDGEDGSASDDSDSMVPDGNSMPDMKGLRQKATMAGAGGATAAASAALQALRMFLQWLQHMASQVAAAVGSLWGSIVAMAQTAVATVMTYTGLSFVASAVVTATTTVAAVGSLAVGLITGTTNEARMDETLVCVPSDTTVASEVVDWSGSGETSLLQQETVLKAWSVFSEMGISKEVAAGVIGNFSAESSLDPTAVETIYDEPFQIGPKKQKAMDANFEAAIIAPSYKAVYPNVHNLGIGIGQWSNSRNITIRDYADSRGLDWFDIGTQLAFMFDGDNPGDVDILWDIANQEGISLTEATSRFVHEWERPDKSALNMSGRQNEAARIYLDMETMEVDTDYAQSIISQMNVDTATSNSNRSAYLQDDGCGGEVRDHYANALDGTGVFPEGIVGTMWSPDNLPSELNAFTHNPEDAGMVYGGSGGWISNGYPGQCVAFADSYMENLYGVPRPGGANGGDVAKVWADKYSGELGGELSDIPSAGAVFSNMNPGVYGHTGVVQHVFANGDILIAEQNINGISGDNNGTPYTWGWRLITAETYQTDDDKTWDWVFYKPDMEPQWVK